MEPVINDQVAFNSEASKERSARRLRNRLLSVRNGLESKSIKSFDELFAILSLTTFAEKVGMSFHTFKKKVEDPMQFTVKEIATMSTLIDTPYWVVHGFLMERLNEQLKSRKEFLIEYEPL